jgi:hypothetical protein
MMKRQINTSKPAMLVLLCAMSVGSVHANTAEAVATHRDPQGRNWDSIKQLPDWSGTWALDLKGHEFGTLEAHSVGPAGVVGFVPFTPKAAEMLAAANRDHKTVNLSHCLPAGVPGVMLHTLQLEWLFTPGRITLLTENGEVRRIYTDGRAHLSFDELEGSYEGDSTGHWEGKTLVVDTVNFPNGSLLKDGFLLATKNTHYVERIYLKDKNHLEIDSVVSDPEIFTKPYSATRIYERLKAAMTEPKCSQTTHDHGETIDLTPPPEDKP